MDKINIFLAMIEASANDKFDNEFNRVCGVLSKTWQFREAKAAAQQKFAPDAATSSAKCSVCGNEEATLICQSCS